MERVTADVEGLDFGVGDLDALLIGPLNERTSDGDSPGRSRRESTRVNPTHVLSHSTRFIYFCGSPKQDAAGQTPLSVGRSQGMDGTRVVGASNGVIGGIMPLRECRAGRASHGLTSSEAVSMQKPPTGEKLW